MGGTLATACPKCGRFGPCEHSGSPEQLEGLTHELKVAKEEALYWQKLSEPKPRTKPKDGVWCAFYPESTRPYVFGSELEALRFAQDLDGGMTVKLIEYGSYVE